jgi:hypothetical protein
VRILKSKEGLNMRISLVLISMAVSFLCIAQTHAQSSKNVLIKNKGSKVQTTKGHTTISDSKGNTVKSNKSQPTTTNKKPKTRKGLKINSQGNMVKRTKRGDLEVKSAKGHSVNTTKSDGFKVKSAHGNTVEKDAEGNIKISGPNGLKVNVPNME